jgi:pyruvate kinase
MLSEETAVGKYPLKAVETMALTIAEAEKIFPHDKFASLPPTDESDVVNESVVMLADNITASAILSLTTSSLSARKLARYKPKKPIYAITYDIKVSRWLTLSWGVVPAFRTSHNSLQDIFTEVIKDGIDRAILNMEESYVLTASYPVGTPGAINLIRVLKKSELSHYFLKAES